MEKIREQLREEADMNLLALDISSTAVGWTWMDGRKREAGGTIWRAQTETLPEFAEKVHLMLMSYGPLNIGPVRWVYEVNYAPVPAAKREGVLRCNQAIGRVLQALGVEGEEYRADNKKKPKRRKDMELIYGRKKMSEHEADSLALAHRATSEVKP